MDDKEYEEFNAKVKERGHFSRLSPLIDFISFGNAGNNWLDITWGGSHLRLNIEPDRIRMIYSGEIEATKDAINSLTVRRRKNWNAALKTWEPVETPVPLSDVLYARERRCFGCDEMIDEATLTDGQIVTLDKDRVRHKIRCEG